MSEYKAFVEISYRTDSVKIHAQIRSGETKAYLTYKDGHVIATTIPNCEYPPDGACLMDLPEEVYNAVERAVLERVERQGGAPTQQSLRGEIKRLEDEVKWLRGLVSGESRQAELNKCHP